MNFDMVGHAPRVGALSDTWDEEETAPPLVGGLQSILSRIIIGGGFDGQGNGMSNSGQLPLDGQRSVLGDALLGGVVSGAMGGYGGMGKMLSGGIASGASGALNGGVAFP